MASVGGRTRSVGGVRGCGLAISQRCGVSGNDGCGAAPASRLRTDRLLTLVVAFTMGLAAMGGGVAFARPSVVVIDAGHGGHDRGGIPGQRASEKALALDTALRLERVLKAQGYRTVMTRRGDYFVSLPGRCAISNRYRNALFVSVHYNSSTRAGASGIETFCYGSSSSTRLAASIQRQLVRSTRADNRGVKRRGFYVLRNNRNIAVLVECGFLTNPGEAKLAASSRHRQLLAEQIAKGIDIFSDSQRSFAPGNSVAER